MINDKESAKEEEIGYLVTVSNNYPELLVPPINFAMVAKGIYRSGYPNKRNFPFLRSIKLRMIICLAAEGDFHAKLKQESEEFIKEFKITRVTIPVEGHKEPFKMIKHETIRQILTNLLDTRNHPVLIHCDKGMHRTGVVIACLRKLMSWRMASIFYEYESFTKRAVRLMDHRLIEEFKMNLELFSEDSIPAFLIQYQKSFPDKPHLTS